MAAGDPMWQCEHCHKTYFMNVQTSCNCLLRRQEDLANAFMMAFTPYPSNPTGEIGVIVGRFQCSHVHIGHKELIEYVLTRHPRVFVFIGQTPVRGSKKDPLPFQARRAMLETQYPTLEVFKMDDVFDVKKWSQTLDRQIDILAGVGQKVTLYGSRDHFAYEGKHPVVEVPCKTIISSSDVRKGLGTKWQNDRKWREGVIWATQNRFPICYPTVDIAVVDFKKNKVLLGKKPNEPKWRFPGGFADKGSPSYEMDALRELKEETQLHGTGLEYIGSTIIDDPRYRSQDDKIKTLFYAVTSWNGEAKADDDLAEVQWFDLDTVTENDMMPTHHILLTMLMNWKDKLIAVAKHLKQ